MRCPGLAKPMQTTAKEKGSSLIEVLISLLILMILMIGVLEMFSLAFLQNMGSAARTDMTYRSAQFVEDLRYLNYLYKTRGAIPSSIVSGITFPLSATTSSQTVNPATATFWGANGMNLVTPTSPFVLSYQINDAATLWAVTVTITPNTTTGNRYIGAGLKNKSIMFQAEIPK